MSTNLNFAEATSGARQRHASLKSTLSVGEAERQGVKWNRVAYIGEKAGVGDLHHVRELQRLNLGHALMESAIGCREVGWGLITWCFVRGFV